MIFNTSRGSHKGRLYFNSLAIFTLIIAFTFFGFESYGQDGKALFTSNCASCHNPLKDATGPKLKGVVDKVPSREWLHSWVHNSSKLITSGDKYAVDIYNQWNKLAMPPFENLSNEEIDAIFDYVESIEPPAAPTNQVAPEVPKDNTWLYAIITLILALLVFVLWRVNRSLEKVSNERRGLPNKKDVPVLKNKLFIGGAAIVLIALAGYWVANGSVEMGRQQNYMPEQPIFYSHKVHAGINQINCEYCHVGVEKSRQAIIPSTNVCMNCHMQISEYTGEQLYDYEGNKIDGTEEIKKLYKYAGWDGKKYKLNEDGAIAATPIQWVKVHNMPDHVYFSHEQHVAVGKVQCQSCHGEVQNMDEVKQFAPLSMGWCVNCHRETNVQFENNDYYKIFSKYHDEVKSGKRTGVTIAELGGDECQKCHY